MDWSGHVDGIIYNKLAWRFRERLEHAAGFRIIFAIRGEVDAPLRHRIQAVAIEWAIDLDRPSLLTDRRNLVNAILNANRFQRVQRAHRHISFPYVQLEIARETRRHDDLQRVVLEIPL